MTEYTAAAESPIDKAQAGSLHRNRKGLSPCQGVNFFDCLVPTSYLEIMDSQRQISILCQNKTKSLDVILPPSFYPAKVLVTQSLTKMMSDTWYKPFLTCLSSISSQREHIWITFCPPATNNRRSSPPVHQHRHHHHHYHHHHHQHHHCHQYHYHHHYYHHHHHYYHPYHQHRHHDHHQYINIFIITSLSSHITYFG